MREKEASDRKPESVQAAILSLFTPSSGGSGVFTAASHI